MSTSIQSSQAGRAILPEPVFRSLFGLVRHIAIGGIAGLVTGIVVGGGGGRLFMRIAGAAARDAAQGATTEAGFTVGEVTFGGTVALIVFVGVFVGVVGAALYLIFRPWLSWTGRWRGAAVGVVLFAAGSATSDVMNPDNFDFLILGNSLLLVALIASLFLAFGFMINGLFRFLDTRLPGEGEGWRAVGCHLRHVQRRRACPGVLVAVRSVHRRFVVRVRTSGCGVVVRGGYRCWHIGLVDHDSGSPLATVAASRGRDRRIRRHPRSPRIRPRASRLRRRRHHQHLEPPEATMLDHLASREHAHSLVCHHPPPMCAGSRVGGSLGSSTTPQQSGAPSSRSHNARSARRPR